jgi:prepilin-type processing-associated H-X9-DG protein
MTDNENGAWRQIILTSSSNNIERQDVWNPGHLPTSTSDDITYGRRVAAARHADGCNGTFLDGHSAWIQAKTMTVNMWRDRWK